MTWLAWRQFRTQLVISGVALLTFGAYLVVVGLRLRGSAMERVTQCTSPNSCLAATAQLHSSFETQLRLLGVVLLALPALIGVFWGAPVVAREVENGTHRLVWSQSITRTRWLLVKLAVITLAAVALTALLSLLLTWASAPYDRLVGDRFAALEFGSRNLVPIGYTVFAVLVGTTAGLLLRKTLPAMAVTLLVVVAVQVFVPLVVRPHLLPATTSTVHFGRDWLDHADFIGPATKDFSGHAPAGVGGYRVPGALMLSSESVLLHSDGTVLRNAQMQACGDGASTAICLAKENLHFLVSYQPASRYWPFQVVETLVLLVVASALAAFSAWRISGNRGLA
jgi:hypothetical protein